MRRFKRHLVRVGACRGKTLVWRALQGYSEDGVGLLAAALAFHALLSLAPLVLVSVAIAGAVLGRGTARRQVTELMQQALGEKMTDTINSWVDQASRGSGIASVVGILLLLWAASRLGDELREALNRILHEELAADAGVGGAVKDYVKRRLFAFVLVACSGPLLVVVFLSRTLLVHFHRLILPGLPGAAALLQVSHAAFTLVLVALGSSLVLRFVPDRGVPWRPALVGGGVISILFSAGNVLVGLYLDRAEVGAVYGIASSAVVVLLWLQFSSTVFLFGVELIRAYAESLTRRP